jgi:hypothetical protein
MKLFRVRRKVHPALALVATLAGCTGVIGEPGTRGGQAQTSGGQDVGPGSGTVTGGSGTGGAGGGGSIGDPSCAAKTIVASPSRLRRLSPEEYTNTVRDLLAAPAAAPKLEPPQGDVVTELEVARLNVAAKELVASKAHHVYLPCDVTGPPNGACAATFIDKFATLAFRRPLEADERSWLVGTYTKISELTGVTPPTTFRESIDAVAEVILQSPEIVYRDEIGVADGSLPPGVRRLTGYERATSLSYLLWSTMPDERLRIAAGSGELDTQDGVRIQAARLLSDVRARQMVRRFASTWLGLDATPMHPALETMGKNKAKFPYDSAALRDGMRRETESLYEHVFFDENGSFRALLQTNRAYVNGPLATMYGVQGGPSTADQYAWVTLDPTQRAGILTRAAFLASEASADYQSPVNRGVFVLRHALCQPLPPPPPNVDNTPPVPGVSSQLRSVRALLEAKTAGGSCQACHGMINPIGFSFESYDAIGAWQTQEKGNVDGVPYTVDVDAKATVDAADLRGTVKGGVELSALLADSEDARACVIQKWFEKALSRPTTDEDRCLLADLRARLAKSDDLKDVVVALASSDAALFIKEATP